MNIAICDDDDRELNAVNEMIDTWMNNQGRNVSVSVFHSPDVLYNAILDGKRFDLFILDVLMPVMNGVELAKKLRSCNYVAEEAPIIFLTSSREFAVGSYEVRAFNYLIKPVSLEKIGKVLGEALDSIKQRENDIIFVHTKDGECYMNRAEICYVAFENRGLVFVCSERTVKSLSIQESFKSATSDFDADPRFFRCGASIIVNLSVVRSVDKNIVTFANDNELTIPRNSAKDTYQAWLDYFLD